MHDEVKALLNTPDMTRRQQTEGLILLDLLHGLAHAENYKGLGPANPDCCPVLRITHRTVKLMRCVTFNDNHVIPWTSGGSSAQPMWWLDAYGVISSEVAAYTNKARSAAEETDGGS